MNYLSELDALQRWLYGTAGIKSLRLTQSPPKLARPVVLFETPYVKRDRNLDRYLYVKRTQQYCKLFVNSLVELVDYQEKLTDDLENRVGILPMYDGDKVIGHLKDVTITFNQSDSLDVPFTLEYETTYSRKKPEAAPRAVTVGNRIVIREWG